MKNIQVHEAMQLSCPDGFREMSPEEVNKVASPYHSHRFGIWDEKGRLMVIIVWHYINVFSMSLTDPRTSLYGVEMRMRHMYQPYDYKKTASLRREIGGRKAKGYAYEYTINGQYQSGEVYMFRNKRDYYTLYTYAWEPMEGAVKDSLQGILDSIQLT